MTDAPAFTIVPKRRVTLQRFDSRSRATGETVKIDQVVLETMQRPARVDEVMHPKQTRCPRCGGKPELTRERSEEGALKWLCRACSIRFAQKLPAHLALGLCSVINVRDVRLAQGKPDVMCDALPEGEPRIITRADCKACPWWKYSFAKGRPCPNFKGRVGVDWRKEEHYVRS